MNLPLMQIMRLTEMISYLHATFDVPVVPMSDGALEERMRLVHEEYRELRDHTSPENLLKECVDLVIVVLGLCARFGWDFDEAFRRVYQEQFSKLVDGKPVKNEYGKWIKGPNFVKADLSDLV
jgi:hypothetical protein